MTKLQKKNKDFLTSLSKEKQELLSEIKAWIIEQELSLEEIMIAMQNKGFKYVGKGKTAVVFDFAENLVIRISNGQSGTAYEYWAEFAEKQKKSMIVPRYEFIQNIIAPYSAYTQYIGSIIIMEKLQSLYKPQPEGVLFLTTAEEFIQKLDTQVDDYQYFSKSPKYKSIKEALNQKQIFDEKDFRDFKRFMKTFSLNDLSTSNVMFNPTTKKLVLTDPSFF